MGKLFSAEGMSLIGQALTFLTALLAAALGYYNKKSIAETQAKIQEVHLTINSRLSDLLEAAKAASFSAGRDEEVARSRAELQTLQDRGDAEIIRQRDETEAIRQRTEKQTAAAPGTVKVEGPGTVSITGAAQTTPKPKEP